MPIPAIIGGAGKLIGAVAGASAASKQRKAAEAAAQRAIQYLESVGVPSAEAQQVVFENPEFVSQFTPEAEEMVELGPSRFEEIETDPRLAEAQMAALSSLQEMGETPLTAAEKAELGAIRRGTAAEEQARQGAILQEMAARGAGGAGAELAARLSSSQAATQRAGEESERTAAMAQQRALQAIADAGQLGGKIRAQEFGEQADVASAADAIARFNIANQLAMQQRNVQARNLAAQQEAATRQALEQQRAQNLTAQQIYNKRLLQQQYENQMRQAEAMSRALTGESQRQAQGAATTAENVANIGGAIGDIGGQIAGYAMRPTTTQQPVAPQPSVQLGTPQISVAPQPSVQLGTPQISFELEKLGEAEVRDVLTKRKAKDEDQQKQQAVYTPFPTPNVGTVR